MFKCCLTCEHWQGTKYSKWGDCNHICGEIIPCLGEYKNYFGWGFELPFDPHDIKYFESEFHSHFLKAGEYGLPEHVRKVTRKENDLKFIISQYDGSIIGERIAPRKIVYFQTEKFKKGCGYYEVRKLALHR